MRRWQPTDKGETRLGRLVAENFLRVDIDGEGSVGGAFELTVDGVRVR